MTKPLLHRSGSRSLLARVRLDVTVPEAGRRVPRPSFDLGIGHPVELSTANALVSCGGRTIAQARPFTKPERAGWCDNSATPLMNCCSLSPLPPLCIVSSQWQPILQSAALGREEERRVMSRYG